MIAKCLGILKLGDYATERTKRREMKRVIDGANRSRQWIESTPSKVASDRLRGSERMEKYSQDKGLYEPADRGFNLDQFVC